MTRLSIHTNTITNTIELRLDFQVDYNPALANKDYNNNGTWGKIVNNGMVVDSIKYNPNVWKGEDCYQSVLAEMKNRMFANS